MRYKKSKTRCKNLKTIPVKRFTICRKICNFAGMKAKDEKVRHIYTMQDVYDELKKCIDRQNQTILVLEIWLWILTISLFFI